MIARAAPLMLAPAMLAASCGGNSVPDDRARQQAMKSGAPEVVSGNEAVATADLSRTDPETMSHAEIEKVLDPAPGCSFSLTRSGGPVLAVRAPAEEAAVARGVIKVHGNLVPLAADSPGGFRALQDGVAMTAESIRVTVAPLKGEQVDAEDGLLRWKADMRFMLEQGLNVGYGGFYTCRG